MPGISLFRNKQGAATPVGDSAAHQDTTTESAAASSDLPAKSKKLFGDLSSRPSTADSRPSTAGSFMQFDMSGMMTFDDSGDMDGVEVNFEDESIRFNGASVCDTSVSGCVNAPEEMEDDKTDVKSISAQDFDTGMVDMDVDAHDICETLKGDSSFIEIADQKERGKFSIGILLKKKHEEENMPIHNALTESPEIKQFETLVHKSIDLPSEAALSLSGDSTTSRRNSPIYKQTFNSTLVDLPEDTSKAEIETGDECETGIQNDSNDYQTLNHLPVVIPEATSEAEIETKDELENTKKLNPISESDSSDPMGSCLSSKFSKIGVQASSIEPASLDMAIIVCDSKASVEKSGASHLNNTDRESNKLNDGISEQSKLRTDYKHTYCGKISLPESYNMSVECDISESLLKPTETATSHCSEIEPSISEAPILIPKCNQNNQTTSHFQVEDKFGLGCQGSSAAESASTGKSIQLETKELRIKPNSFILKNMSAMKGVLSAKNPAKNPTENSSFSENSKKPGFQHTNIFRTQVNENQNGETRLPTPSGENNDETPLNANKKVNANYTPCEDRSHCNSRGTACIANNQDHHIDVKYSTPNTIRDVLHKNRTENNEHTSLSERIGQNKSFSKVSFDSPVASVAIAKEGLKQVSNEDQVRIIQEKIIRSGNTGHELFATQHGNTYHGVSDQNFHKRHELHSHHPSQLILQARAGSQHGKTPNCKAGHSPQPEKSLQRTKTQNLERIEKKIYPRYKRPPPFEKKVNSSYDHVTLLTDPIHVKKRATSMNVNSLPAFGKSKDVMPLKCHNSDHKVAPAITPSPGARETSQGKSEMFQQMDKRYLSDSQEVDDEIARKVHFGNQGPDNHACHSPREQKEKVVESVNHQNFYKNLVEPRTRATTPSVANLDTQDTRFSPAEEQQRLVTRITSKDAEGDKMESSEEREEDIAQKKFVTLQKDLTVFHEHDQDTTGATKKASGVTNIAVNPQTTESKIEDFDQYLSRFYIDVRDLSDILRSGDDHLMQMEVELAETHIEALGLQGKMVELLSSIANTKANVDQDLAKVQTSVDRNQFGDRLNFTNS